MAKQLISIRISAAARGKLLGLAQRFGTQTTVVEIALDRMYREEIPMPGQCIMVRDNAGYYQITDAEVEDWTDVIAAAEGVHKIDDLLGWHPYTAAYRVCLYPTGEVTYFVAE